VNWRATDLEDMIGGYILWGLFIFSCIVCMIYSAVSRGDDRVIREWAEQGTNWQKAYVYVKENPKKEVLVFLVDVSTPNGEPVDVFLKDGKKEYKVGSISFYAFNEGNFILTLVPALEEMKEAPSKNTEVILRAKKGVKVKCKKIMVTPLFLD
jgi:hypothetical protein